MKIYEIINKLRAFGKKCIDIFCCANRRFNEVNASEIAASLAYYAIFSLFPLILVLITIGSFILEKELIQNQIMQWLEDFFPLAQNLIIKNIESVIRLRGTVGAMALVGLLWAATNVFFILTLNINRAFPEANLRGFVKNRLMALMMVGFMVAIMIVSLVMNTISNLLVQFQINGWFIDNPQGLSISNYLSDFINYLLLFLVVFLLYWWVPNVSVEPKSAISGAIFTVIGWELTTKIFMWYLHSGFVHYELVYGSLGTIISMMLWLYLSSIIILYGAHLASAINRCEKSDEQTALENGLNS